MDQLVNCLESINYYCEDGYYDLINLIKPIKNDYNRLSKEIDNLEHVVISNQLPTNYHQLVLDYNLVIDKLSIIKSTLKKKIDCSNEDLMRLMRELKIDQEYTYYNNNCVTRPMLVKTAAQRKVSFIQV